MTSAYIADTHSDAFRAQKRDADTMCLPVESQEVKALHNTVTSLGPFFIAKGSLQLAVPQKPGGVLRFTARFTAAF